MLATTPDEDIRDYLTRSHHLLDELYTRLLEAMASNGPDVRDLWSELDCGLRAHMEAEERFVIPSFAHTDRREAIELLREHHQIRLQLLELGVAVDLHAIRFEHSRDFIELLRAHAAREEHLLYRWADAQLERRLREAARAKAS